MQFKEVYLSAEELESIGIV